VSDAIAAFLKQSGLEERIDQAGIIPEWNALVGDPIARVTMPVSVSRTGILLVAVRTNAWMTELSLLEPQLLRELNRQPGRAPVRKIRWRLMER
jgi:predicted nucleic acid-binding Zn ribbon protein